MERNGVRPGVWLAVAALAGLVLLVVLRSGDKAPAPPPLQGKADPGAPTAATDETRAGRTREPRGASAPAAAEEAPPYIEGLVYGEIDLREAKELMPDNLYWQLGAPTKDEKVLAERDAETKRRNEEYGRVLAGDAGEDEVRAYYDYRRRLSADYLEFAEFMHRRHKDSGEESFVGMLALAVKMHSEKLAALDAEMEEALKRSRDRAKVREDWRRQQEEFGLATPPAGEAAE